MPWYAIQENGAEVRRVFVLNDADLSLQMKQGQTSQPSSDPRNLVFAAPAPPTLDEEKAARWALGKIHRDTITLGGCSTPKGKAQTDPTSVARIAAFAATAQSASADWAVNWIMADNSVVAHNPADMIAMNDAVTSFLNACSGASEAIRAAIDTATDAAGVAAVDITAGYPS